ncbi:ABC-three component system protein [Ferrimonas aestuarii]|uniref:ABC-three component systems C-terminal domain-containing protein n=1 Tax=Ferrimonas aestuarii TaxID=2569539 RepID=A0A4U1BK82_9GAMM|nr:ABC-three component system protein [Ferrimonas aestuarii]TKB52020.1 hypothetical protein FCL42_16515 [Ferrimonas aestuarii]
MEKRKLLMELLADQVESINEKNQTISENQISNVSTDNGDIFIGSKDTQYKLNFEPPQVNPEQILLLVDRYKNVDCESKEFIAIKEELEEYQTPRPGRKIIGLENKLKAGNREDLIPTAKEYKKKFASRLMRYELCTHTSAIHLNIMGKIEEKFNSTIIPMIESKTDQNVIDLAISKLIIEPLADEVSAADPTLTPKQVRGMMYLLTGNCFLQW